MKPAAPASLTRCRTVAGAICVMKRQMLRPPRSRKIKVNSASRAPVTISVTVPAVDRAPLVNSCWWSRIVWIAVSPKWLIWSGRRCSGPLISQCRAESILRVTWSARSGSPSANWVMTKARIDPTRARPQIKTRATAPPRGAPRRLRKSTAGTSRAVSINASAAGTMTTPNLIKNCNSTHAATAMINSRHDHAAALRTKGATAASSEDIDTTMRDGIARTIGGRPRQRKRN